MKARGSVLMLLYLMSPLAVADGRTDSNWLGTLVEPLAGDGRGRAEELTDSQIAAVESICELSALYRPAIVDAVKQYKVSTSVFAAAERCFRNQAFEKACVLYGLALEDVGNLGGPPGRVNAMAKAARYRITLVRDNNDFGGEPLRLYADAVSCRYPLVERQILEQIRLLYPESKIIDDVDLRIGANLYPRDRSELAAYWEAFLKTHSQSPLRDDVERRLTIVYCDLGVKAIGNDEALEADQWFRLVLDWPAVLDCYAYAAVAEFFECQRDLSAAERAYVKGLHQGWPEAYVALALFYERHYGLAEYVRFLLGRGADEREIERRLTDLEEMRSGIESKWGSI